MPLGETLCPTCAKPVLRPVGLIHEGPDERVVSCQACGWRGHAWESGAHDVMSAGDWNVVDCPKCKKKGTLKPRRVQPASTRFADLVNCAQCGWWAAIQ